MGHFVKLTTFDEANGSYTRTWLEQSSIKQLSQNSATQAETNEATCEFVDGTIIELTTFNETLDTLN